jgi:ferric-dicitrate binding protein FerR (iron transport regulator)
MTVDRFWDLLSKKVSSEASETELKELEEIILTHPDWKNTAEALSILEHQSIPFENNQAEAAFEKHIERMRKCDIEFHDPHVLLNSEPELQGKKSGIRKWKLAVGLFVVSGLIFFILRNDILSPGRIANERVPLSQVSTKPGSRTQIQLPDGSTVWLNSNSNLTYGEDFGKKIREVNLTGEAFFDVVKDHSRPFIIHTKVIDVKVLGTAFNVKSYPNDANTETSLIRGKVEVTVKNRENTKYYLQPNEKVIVANNAVSEVTPVIKKQEYIKPLVSIQPLTYYHFDSSIIETSWVENKLIFQENETFKEVALKMERWYGVHISFADPKLAEYRMYGSFTKETIKQALDALKIVFNFNFKIDGDEIIITK